MSPVMMPPVLRPAYVHVAAGQKGWLTLAAAMAGTVAATGRCLSTKLKQIKMPPITLAGATSSPARQAKCFYPRRSRP